MKEADVYPTRDGLRYRACKVHGPLNKQVELRITSGSTVPTVGETLTGATSGDTGVVVSVRLESGTWAGGDAVATIVINNHTGVDEDTGEWGSGTEEINGSISGTSIMTRYVAPQQTSGVIFPESSMVFYDSAWYCIDCYRRKFVKKFLDDSQITDDDEYFRSGQYT